MKKRTLVDLFEESCRKFPENTLFLEKQGKDYRSTCCREAKHLVRRFAAGLLEMGCPALSVSSRKALPGRTAC